MILRSMQSFFWFLLYESHEKKLSYKGTSSTLNTEITREYDDLPEFRTYPQ